MYKFEEELNKKDNGEFTTDRVLTTLRVCLHVAIAVVCFIIFAKLDSAFKALDMLSEAPVSTELAIFNMAILFAAFSNIASSVAIVYRQYKREKYEKAFNDLFKKSSQYEETFREFADDIKELNSVKCKKCGTAHPAGTKFCQNCGQSLMNENKPKKAE